MISVSMIYMSRIRLQTMKHAGRKVALSDGRKLQLLLGKQEDMIENLFLQRDNNKH